ncbi:MAG: hypothetical protein AAGL66_13005, partial [Pseudomonadota bacterium]
MKTKHSKVSMEDMEDALARVLSSTDFDKGGRLGRFLSYVVEEECAGRGEPIRGKTIAQDVYGRAPKENGDPENIVRVDARRLRQQLEHYYATAGARDPVQIHIDPGSYRPRFETFVAPSAGGRMRTVRTLAIYAGLFVLGTLAGAGLTALFSPANPDPDAFQNSAQAGSSIPENHAGAAAERTAMYQKSPATLEAIALAEQGHRMLFPIFDPPRQELLTSVFERVIELDPDYYGGYAGLAHVQSIRALLTPDPDLRKSLRGKAQGAADEALRLSPAEPRTLTALALCNFLGGDHLEALRLAELAVELAPDDGQTLDMLGTIAVFSGAFERALEASVAGGERESSNQRFANRNIYAAASYHLGNYREAYETLDEAAALGDPLSAPSLAYQAAALAAAGRLQEARGKLDKLNKGWPNAPLEAMLRGF